MMNREDGQGGRQMEWHEDDSKRIQDALERGQRMIDPSENDSIDGARAAMERHIASQMENLGARIQVGIHADQFGRWYPVWSVLYLFGGIACIDTLSIILGMVLHNYLNFTYSYLIEMSLLWTCNIAWGRFINWRRG
jgi:hypothetical protein